MKLKELICDDVFHFENDNDEVEFVVVYECESIIQFDALSIYNSTSLCLSKSFDFLTNVNVIKLYNRSV